VVQAYYTAFPDYDGAIDIQVAQGDWIAGTGYVTGTHLGEWLGIPPTGLPVKMRYSDFWRFEDGLLAENWVMTDDLDVMRQLGVDLLARRNKA
jgi:predicted ester cyclase